MNTLLASKGFILNPYKDGNFYEYKDENGNEKTLEIAKLFGYNGEEAETVILQCDENIQNCILYVDLNIWHMTTEDFIECVNNM